MNIKKWIKDNVEFRREETEIRDNQGYGATLAAVGLLTGVGLAVIVIILQMVMGSATAAQSVVNVLFAISGVAMLAYLVWLLLPMYKDNSISIGSKVVTSLIALVCLIVPFIVGAYIIVLAVMALVLFAAFWFMGKMWGASEKAKRDNPDFIETMLGLGGNKKSDGSDGYDTIDSEYGTLYGERIDKDRFFANGTIYKRTYEGGAEVWKEE